MEVKLVVRCLRSGSCTFYSMIEVGCVEVKCYGEIQMKHAFIYGACVSCSRLVCVKFIHNTLCRTVTPFSSRSYYEWMNEFRLRFDHGASLVDVAQWHRHAAFNEKRYLFTDNSDDPCISHIFYNR